MTENVRWGGNDNTYLLDTYKSGPVFAWLGWEDGKLKRVHQWSRCRDIVGNYLQGAIDQRCHDYGGVAYQKGVSIDPPVDQLTLGIRLGKADTEGGITFGTNLNALVWPLEEKMHLTTTEMVEHTAGHPSLQGSQLWVLKADPFWMKAPPLLSLYLLLIRATPYLNPDGDLNENLTKSIKEVVGCEHLKELSETIAKIVKKGKDAWKAPQEAYYKGPKFSYQGLLHFAEHSWLWQRNYMKHGTTIE